MQIQVFRMSNQKRLFVVVGKPGHGKSYVSNIISELTGAIHLETDKIRKNHIVDDEQKPKFTPEETKRTYDTMFNLADEYFNDEGHSVVLDGTFINGGLRKKARDIGGEQTELVKITCPENKAKKRMEQRNDETTADIYNKFHMQPIKYSHTVIDNSGSKNETEKQIKDKLL